MKKVRYTTIKEGKSAPWPRKWTKQKKHADIKKSIQTYNTFKSLVWSSVVNSEIEEDKRKHVVNGKLLLGVVRELET